MTRDEGFWLAISGYVGTQDRKNFSAKDRQFAMSQVKTALARPGEEREGE